jgi:hypothetical protein
MNGGKMRQLNLFEEERFILQHARVNPDFRFKIALRALEGNKTALRLIDILVKEDNNQYIDGL